MKKIVLIDDNKDYLEVLKEFIECNNKVKCITFSNPVEAYDYISTHDNIDIIITDYEMPGLNGVELAKKILEKFSNKKIIISSGHDERILYKVIKKEGLDTQVAVICKDNINFFSHLV